MKETMKTFLSLLLLASVSSQIVLGEDAQKQEVVEAEAVVEAQEEVPLPGPTAVEQLQQILKKKDWQLGYDEQKDRIIVLEHVEFDIKNPKVSADFLELRQEKMSELSLKAKAKIIEMMYSTMSGSRLLTVPGNPIAQQLAKLDEEIENGLREAALVVEKLDGEFRDAREKRDQMSVSESMAVLNDWFSKKEDSYAAKLNAEKKAEYQEAKELLATAKKQYEEKIKEVESLRRRLVKEMKTTISRVAAQPLYGCTVLCSAEAVLRKNGRYRFQIAVLYMWSADMHKAAGKILQGESVTFTPGKKPFKEFIQALAERGALSTWVGPRMYIDDEGKLWFIGISCAPESKHASSHEANREMAGLQAAAEVMFSLYSDVMSRRHLDKVLRETESVNGERETKLLKDYSKEQRETFNNISISGLVEVFSGTLTHAASGIDIQVVVSAINSGDMRSLRNIHTQAMQLNIDVNLAQARERGRLQRYQQYMEESKDNKAARQTGVRQADGELQKSQEAVENKKPEHPFRKKKRGGKSSGELRPGVYYVDPDDL